MATLLRVDIIRGEQMMEPFVWNCKYTTSSLSLSDMALPRLPAFDYHDEILLYASSSFVVQGPFLVTRQKLLIAYIVKSCVDN